LETFQYLGNLQYFGNLPVLWEPSGILLGLAFAQQMVHILRIIKHGRELSGILVEPSGILVKPSGILAEPSRFFVETFLGFKFSTEMH